MELEAAVDALEACMVKGGVPLESALMKVVVEAGGALKPSVVGVDNPDTAACLEARMRALDIKQTGPGMCLARWRLR